MLVTTPFTANPLPSSKSVFSISGGELYCRQNLFSLFLVESFIALGSLTSLNPWGSESRKATLAAPALPPIARLSDFQREKGNAVQFYC